MKENENDEILSKIEERLQKIEKNQKNNSDEIEKLKKGSNPEILQEIIEKGFEKLEKKIQDNSKENKENQCQFTQATEILTNTIFDMKSEMMSQRKYIDDKFSNFSQNEEKLNPSFEVEENLFTSFEIKKSENKEKEKKINNYKN